MNLIFKNKISLCENEYDLSLVKSEIQETGDSELITAYNLKCSNLELNAHAFIE